MAVTRPELPEAACHYLLPVEIAFRDAEIFRNKLTPVAFTRGSLEAKRSSKYSNRNIGKKDVKPVQVNENMMINKPS